MQGITINSPADVAPALAQLRKTAARPAPKPAPDADHFARNRRTLIKALSEGCRYLGVDDNGAHLVSSRTNRQPRRIVEQHNPNPRARFARLVCNCDYGRTPAAISAPCGHALVARLHLVTQTERDEAFEHDVELAETVAEFAPKLIFPWRD